MKPAKRSWKLYGGEWPTTGTGLCFFLLCLISAIILPGVTNSAHAQTDGVDAGYASGQEVVSSTQTLRRRFESQGCSCYQLVVAGVATRHAHASGEAFSTGTITLSGPESGIIVFAALYWVILGDSPPPTDVTLNGIDVAEELLTGTPTGSPCWLQDYAYAYFADVTSIVREGENIVSGLDDSGPPPNEGFESEGASLVVVYQVQSVGAEEIVITDGNDLRRLPTTRIDNALPITSEDGKPARLYFIGGDGQNDADDRQLWNNIQLGDDDAFDNSDPKAPGAFYVGWDSDGWNVVTGQQNTASVDDAGGNGDCVNWVATAIEIGQCDEPSSLEPTSWGRVKAMSW